MTIIGIDFGDRRVGIAKSEGVLASGVCTVKVTGIEDAVEKTAMKIQELGGTKIVLGLPRNMDGSEGFRALAVRAFADLLRAETTIPLDFADERLSTVEAHGFLDHTGTRGKKRKEVIDAVAAVIILEDYLKFRKNNL